MSHNCRACEAAELVEVLDMGLLPLAGDFRPPGQVNELYPLAIDLCAACGLLQTRDTVPPEVFFHERYSYASSTVPGLVRHFEEYAREVAVEPGTQLRLLEIGCNDGVFLEPLRRVGYQVTGVDASDNVAGMARDKGLDVITGFFSPRLAPELTDGGRRRYGVVTCSNVFAHNPGVGEFLEAVSSVLEDDGEFWVEVHATEMLHDGLQWDFFYHEHCLYWTVASLAACLRRHGFLLKRYRYTSMHGGGIRAAFSRRTATEGVAPAALSVRQWRSFADACRRNRQMLADTVRALPVRCAYGASGRAVILINWANLAQRLECVVDGSPLRYGRSIPGTSVPIISEDEFYARQQPPEWCLVSAHNYLDDIRLKIEAHFPGSLVHFLTPLPNVCVR
jgi:SAM-dependent methyltransferase